MDEKKLVNQQFVEAMEERLQEKYPIYDESWKKMPMHELVTRFREKVNDFLLDDRNMKDCVDVANFSMFVWERLRQMQVFDKVQHSGHSNRQSPGIAYCPYCNCSVDAPYIGCKCRCHNEFW
jgi:hypothetical protein